MYIALGKGDVWFVVTLRMKKLSSKIALMEPAMPPARESQRLFNYNYLD